MSISAVGRPLPVPQAAQTTRVPAAAPDLMAVMVAARPSMEAAQRTAAGAVQASQGDGQGVDVYL